MPLARAAPAGARRFPAKHFTNCRRHVIVSRRRAERRGPRGNKDVHPMKISIAKERRAQERRVAATPDTAKRLVGMGHEVVVEGGAGAGSSFPDSAYEAVGAKIARDAAAALGVGDIVLKVQRPLRQGEDAVDEVALMKRGAVLIGMLQPLQQRADVDAYAKAGLSAFSMELIPRITRAQSMDVLSSQANLAGYRAVLEAAGAFQRGFPMMMTAAGTVPPARVFVIGAGVAGLQAIATARRLGAIVSATDVRPAAKEEIKSLGGTFVGVEDEETAGQTGAYAREMTEAFRQKQAELMVTTVAKNDIVICTALVMGRKAPTIVTKAMVESMKAGSIIVY